MSDVLILDGHPRPGSLGDSLAEAYADGARMAGLSAEIVSIRDLDFDPVLHLGYKGEQPLEPDLRRMQQAIIACRRLVLVYPNWWGGMPAQMKGFIDRTLLPGFAFKYKKEAPYVDRLLTGRSGRIIVTMDAPPWYDRLMYRAGGTHVAKAEILQFIGLKPVKAWRVGPVRGATQARLDQWVAKAKKLGQTDR